MSGESRQELLNWVNQLLNLNYTKIEQMGTGAAHCQILDSIYGISFLFQTNKIEDIPMAKVKFNAKAEYEYIQNFKILQNSFTKHNIDKLAPVERLVKCKFQDNLEFLQWMKRHWDLNFPGGDYNCNERRNAKGCGRSTPAGNARPLASKKTGMPSTPGGGAIRTRTPTNPNNTTIGSNLATIQLQNQVNELQESILGLEKERDFYFSKLRDIELVLQERLEEVEQSGILQDIQKILYSTEEGFEVPEDDGGVETFAADDAETF